MDLKELPDYSQMSMDELVDLFHQMLVRDDQQELYKSAELIKTAFYKILKREKAAAGLYVAPLQNSDVNGEAGTDAVIETSEIEESQAAQGPDNPFIEVEKAFKNLYSHYKDSRAEYLLKLEQQKEENLAMKLEIIEKIKELLESTEDVNSTFPAFRELQNQWKAITLVPQNKAKDLWESYQLYVEKFYDYIKINNEFRDLDFKKNLELKTKLCEKAEALESEPNIVVAFKELQKLHEEWKELGPVAKEYRESIWGRFKAITTVINKKHQNFFEGLKEEQKKNLAEKLAICEKAEEIVNSEFSESNDWNVATKKMEELQAKWKNIGFAAKKENQKIYDRFRMACDKFYDAKRLYYANFKNIMEENLAKKIALCEQAEALMHSDDWRKTTDQLINIQKQWKEVGPVARKQSEIVWKRFRAACDFFFENKSKQLGQLAENYEENLAAKLALIEEVKEFKISDSKDENIAAMREFQNRWNEIGFVPIKEKESVQKAWNSAMDAHFADIRSLDSEKKLNKFKKMVTDLKNSGKGTRGLKNEREKLVAKYRKIEQDIATYENNMGFFAKSKSADALISDLQKKIEIAKNEMIQIEEKIKVIDNQF
ncbi:MAG: DUF349 domain-containing protein [Bacteroidales bacterium]|nr:DUF349 domain-containing protein [Bacteroidales bacterium]